jgi:hypothetical protein
MKSILLILLISTSSFATYHSSCDKYHSGNNKFMVITKTKSSLNKLYLSVNIDQNSCTFIQGESKVTPFWEMGHKVIRGNITCEKILDKEIRKMFGFSSRNAMYRDLSTYMSLDEMEVVIPKLPDYPGIVGSRSRIAKVTKLTVAKVNGKCIFSSQVLLNSRYKEVNRIHLGIKYLPPFIKYVQLYNNKNLVMTLN